MVLTAHFIDESWVYHKRIINFIPLFSHTGDAIGRAIEECLEEWQIENVITITVDNAKANDVAIEGLKERLPNLLRNGDYLHVRCAAHIINLVVQEGLKIHDKTIERVRNAVRYIRQSPIRLENFKSCATDRNIDTKSMLSLDVSTRWNSTHDMLERAVKFEKAFELYARRFTSFRKDLGEIPDRFDWMYAGKMAGLLEFYKRKTIKLSGSSYVIAHQFFNEVMDVEAQLDKLFKEASQTTDFMTLTRSMKHKFQLYFGNESEKKNRLFDFAVILDPRLKLHIVQFSCERICLKMMELDKAKEIIWSMERFKETLDAMVDDIKTEMHLLFKEYEALYNTSSSNPTTTENKFENVQFGENSFLDAFQQYRGGGVCSLSNKTDLEKYLKDEVEENTNSFDILHWWKANSSRYPTLSKMAKDILAIPVSTVASESAFSTGGRVLDSYRSSLAPPIVEALICTQDWVRKSKKAINESDDLEKFDDLAKEIYMNGLMRSEE